jgi:hypothetical protein
VPKIKRKKKRKLIIWLSIIGLFLFLFFLFPIIVNYQNRARYEESNKPAKVNPIEKMITGDLKDYLEIVPNQYEITYDFGGKISVLISGKRKIPENILKNKKIELNLSLFDSSGIPLSGIEDFSICEPSIDKIKIILKEGSGQDAIQFESPIGLNSYKPEQHAEKAKKFKINSIIKNNTK